MTSPGRIVLRAVPFVVFAGAGIWQAGRSPGGRKPAEIDWTVDVDGVARALTKLPHIQWMAVTFLLAVLAVGVRRAWVAALMTLAVGIGWEIAETTVRDHHATIVDLVPDLAGIAVGLVLLAIGRTLFHRFGRRVPDGPR